MPAGPYYASRAYRDEQQGDTSRLEGDAPEQTTNEQESEFPKHSGGGWYELSNGEKVQGKENAEVEEAKLS